MVAVENTLFALLFILTLGLIVPELLKKFRLPLITLIILAGAVTGPNGLDYIQPNEIINFFGFLGMAFLMLMAGLEADISKLNQFKHKILTMAFINGFMPFVTGVLITRFFGYSWETSLLVGIVFISSSVAIIVPSLQGSKFIRRGSAQLILSAVMVTDIVSLIALAVIFQNIQPITPLPLHFYFPILLISVLLLLYLIPRVSRYALRRFSRDEGYERRLRFLIIILVSVLAYFSLLGVHPILAAFLSGLALSQVIQKEKTGILYAKLHTLGYSLFVPVFFFVVGMQINISIFGQLDITNNLMLMLILGLILSKFVSGYFAGRLVRLSKKDSMFFGSISITQLTTTLAVTYAASSLGLLDSVLVTSIILMSIITTILGPLLASYISSKYPDLQAGS